MLCIGTLNLSCLMYLKQENIVHPNMNVGITLSIIPLVLSVLFYMMHKWTYKHVGYYIAFVVLIQLFCITCVFGLKNTNIVVLLLPYGVAIWFFWYILNKSNKS